MERHQLAIAVAIVGALLFGVMYARGHPPVLGQFFAALGPVITVVSILYIAFDKLLWRLPLVRQVVSGGAEIRSNWKDSATGQGVAPIPGFMAIRQSFGSISLRLMTAESASETLAARLIRESDGVWVIAVVYRNMPKVRVRKRSEIHLGAMQLQLHDDRERRMEGHYWTDRGTRGDILLAKRRARVYHSYEAAARR